MYLPDRLSFLRRGWRLLVGAIVVAVALAVAITSALPSSYRAETELFVSTAGGDSLSDLAQGGSFALRQVSTYAALVTTPLVLDDVRESLDLPGTSGDLAQRISSTVAPNTVLIRITVVDEDPEQAAAIANAVAVQFAHTLQELERVDDTRASPVKATVVTTAEVPTRPSSPVPWRNVALAVLLGTLLGGALALLRDALDTRIRGEGDLKDVADLPLVGVVPFDAGAAEHPLAQHDDPHSRRAEAYRSLRTNLIFLHPDDQPRVLLVTSSVMGEGKSVTSANLAHTLAEAGARVCLVEGDLRRPRLAEHLGLENAAGVTDVLVGRADVADVLQPFGEHVVVIGSGAIPPNPSELLGSEAMTKLVARLRADYDYVVIDGPPLLAVTDSAVLATGVDGVLVLARAGLVTRPELRRALDDLDRVGGKVLGLVVNAVPVSGPDAYRQPYEPYLPDTHVEGRGRRVRRRRGRSRKA